ncbi:MAG: hypothetical protein U0795_07805 [Pirellulales bacterium]
MVVKPKVLRLATIATTLVLLTWISSGCRRAEQAPAPASPAPAATAQPAAEPTSRAESPAAEQAQSQPSTDASSLADGAQPTESLSAESPTAQKLPAESSSAEKLPAEKTPAETPVAQSAPVVPPPPADWAQRQPYRALVVTPRGLLLLALVVDIDGRPLPQVWSDRLQEVLTRADTSGDRQTQWTELWKVPSIVDGAYGNMPAPTEQTQYQLQQEFDLDRNGVVNTTELEILLTGTRRRSGPMQWTSDLTTESFHDLAGTLWEWIDVDGDHRVSADERQGVNVRLDLLDLNADDAIRESEFTARSMAGSSNTAATSQRHGEQLLYPVGAKARWADLLYALELIYAGGNDLSTASIPNSPRWMKDLDQDADQRIDDAELSLCEQADPDVLIIGRFTTGQAPTMEVWQATGNPASPWQLNSGTPAVPADGSALAGNAASAGKNDRAEAALQDLGIRLTAIDASAGPDGAGPARQLLEQLDQDKNGHLAGAEAEQAAAAVGSSPARLDGNSDGMVTVEELTRLYDDRRFVGLATLELVLGRDTDRWGGWDTNRDGMLGERERTMGAEVWRQRDRDGDGLLTADELSRTLQIQLLRGGSQPTNRMRVPVPAAASPESETAATQDWLHGMDANGDGEVSWLEFGGDEAMFQQLDRNQDGFLTRDEVPVAGTSG